MTERKPDNVSWESWVERQIQDGLRDGAFDALPGRGRPLDGLDTAHDELWWVKAKLRDERINALPPTIAIRAERADAIDAAMRAATEDEARRVLETVNERIRYLNSHATAGPPSTVVTIDVDVMLQRRHDARDAELAGNQAASTGTRPETGTDISTDGHRRPRRRWRFRRSRV